MTNTNGNVIMQTNISRLVGMYLAISTLLRQAAGEDRQKGGGDFNRRTLYLLRPRGSKPVLQWLVSVPKFRHWVAHL
jgi:hypothetical protein